MYFAAVATSLALGLLNGAAPRYPGAAAVATFDFRATSEGEFGKPEGWTRYEAPDYPFYVDAAVADDPSAIAGRCLRFRLNGGNCAYYSPKIKADPDFSYVVRAQIKTEGLTRDGAFLLVEFLDGQDKVLGVAPASDVVRGTRDWTMVEIGPVAPESANVKFLRIACINKAGVPPDLSGSVSFDDVWIGRLPRFEVEASAPFQLFDLAEPKRVTLKVRGADGRQLESRFLLLDETGAALAEETLAVTASGDQAVLEWELPIPGVGFYLLDVALHEGARPLMRRRYSISVMEMHEGPAAGDFGLSLPPPRLGFDHYERLLAYSGARWVKLPFWNSDPATPKPQDRAFAELLERLARRGHEVVGKLEDPTPQILNQLAEEKVRIADCFSQAPSVWNPSLEATLIRFGLKVTYWQLGADEDASFLGLAGLDASMAVVRKEVQRVGREVRLGVVWDWFMPPPPSGTVDFFAVTDNMALESDSIPAADSTPLAAEELEFQIRALREQCSSGSTDEKTLNDTRPRIWTHIHSLADDQYSRRDRVLDLARRLIAAKVAQSDAIFAVDVSDPRRGMFDADGAPNELFTIFRTLAVHIGDKQPVGRLPVSGPSIHHIFQAGEEVAMVAWSVAPTTLEAVLGRDARVLDLWGRLLQGPTDDETRQIPLSDMPVLIVDVDPFLVRFQLGLRFEHGGVTSRFGAHQDRLLVHNPASAALSGTAAAQFPRSWNARPAEFPLQASQDETTALSFDLTMPQGVPQGEYQIPIDFRLTTSRGYRFRLHRPFRVGGDELRVQITTRTGPEGELEIDAPVTNLTNAPISLTATARTLGRKAEIDFISNLAPSATSAAHFSFRNGAQLAGKSVQIKFEDIGGRREFTYDVVAKP